MILVGRSMVWYSTTVPGVSTRGNAKSALPINHIVLVNLRQLTDDNREKCDYINKMRYQYVELYTTTVVLLLLLLYCIQQQ